MRHLKAEVYFGNLTAMLPLKSVTILRMTSESAYVSAWLEAVTTHWNLWGLEMDMLVHLLGMKHEAPAVEFKCCSHEERKRWLQRGELGQRGVMRAALQLRENLGALPTGCWKVVAFFDDSRKCCALRSKFNGRIQSFSGRLCCERH